MTVIPARPLHTPGVDDSFNRTAQKPSIGRVVHYFQGSMNRPVPAIITEIGEPRADHHTPDVKLFVFWGDSTQDRTQGGWYVHSDEYAAGHWSWPPRV